MKQKLNYILTVTFVTAAGYGVYSNQKSEVMSDVVLANIEALAEGEQPAASECSWPSNSDCWVLHPTDSSKDIIVPNMKWPNS